MFTVQPALYGNYVYGKKTGGVAATLYGSLLVPPTLSLSDVLANVDTTPFTIMKPLQTDILALMDTFANKPSKALSDTLTLQDITSTILTVKQLTDVLLLQDWLSMRLVKANIWRNFNQLSGIVTISRSSVPTLYRTVTYGSSLYLGRVTTTVTRT